jgi:RNA polymerase sigma factor (sigma-70 family)
MKVKSTQYRHLVEPAKGKLAIRKRAKSGTKSRSGSTRLQNIRFSTVPILTTYQPGPIIKHVAKFRIDLIGELSRQLAFTPHESRMVEVAAAEALLREIDPTKAYPLDFIVFKITGYRRRKKRVDETLLTGLALQHDLGLLAEHVSETLDWKTSDCPEPILTIEETAERFDVTTKSIQRWRRRGLGARRMIFPDGKRRVGFLLSNVERYLARHSDQAVVGGDCKSANVDGRAEILRRARILASQCHCDADEICRRIGRKMGRAPLAIRHEILRHDRENPESAIFPAASRPIDLREQIEIARAFKRGTNITELARSFSVPRTAIYRLVIEDRAAHLSRHRVRFIDDPLYHQPDAVGVIEQILSQDELRSDDANADRIPRDLPPYLRELYRTPLLSPARERALFLKLNFHKFEFVIARRKLDLQSVRRRELDHLETLHQRISESKNQIIRANLRLVVSVARKHLRPGLSLMELISDGNLTLMRAVESFDFHKGFRFSTYATLALVKGFAHSVPDMIARARKAKSGDDSSLVNLADSRQGQLSDQLLDREQVQQLLSQLETRERDVILAHYGLKEGQPSTYQQLGDRMGLSKQRVRQIEQAALAKLRSAAGAGE